MNFCRQVWAKNIKDDEKGIIRLVVILFARV